MTGQRRVSFLVGDFFRRFRARGSLATPAAASGSSRRSGRRAVRDRSASVYARSSDRPSGDFGPRPFRCASAFRRECLPGRGPELACSLQHTRRVVAGEEPLGAASPAPAYEAGTEAPVPLRTSTVMIGVPARRTGERIREVERAGIKLLLGLGVGQEIRRLGALHFQARHAGDEPRRSAVRPSEHREEYRP